MSHSGGPPWHEHWLLACMQVLLTTPATSEERMKEITKASEGFVYLVCVPAIHGRTPSVWLFAAFVFANDILYLLPYRSSQVSVIGVTGSRADVDTRVESLIQEVKQVSNTVLKEVNEKFIFFLVTDRQRTT